MTPPLLCSCGRFMQDPVNTTMKFVNFSIPFVLSIYFLFLFEFYIYFSLLKVHITQGDHVGKGVIISWVTPDEPGSNTVVYWADNGKHKMRAEGTVLTYKYYNYTSGYIHHCTIKSLEVIFHFFSKHHSSFIIYLSCVFFSVCIILQLIHMYIHIAEIPNICIKTYY